MWLLMLTYHTKKIPIEENKLLNLFLYKIRRCQQIVSLYVVIPSVIYNSKVQYLRLFSLFQIPSYILSNRKHKLLLSFIFKILKNNDKYLILTSKDIS